jgi:hypothetical protein
MAGDLIDEEAHQVQERVGNGNQMHVLLYTMARYHHGVHRYAGADPSFTTLHRHLMVSETRPIRPIVFPEPSDGPSVTFVIMPSDQSGHCELVPENWTGS